MRNFSKKEWMLVGAAACVFFVVMASSFFPFTSSQSADEMFQWEIEESVEEVEAVIQETSVVVDVKGAVVSPGVYEFTEGSRVIDAIERAGGLTEAADETKVNLAALLEDEMVLFIPEFGEEGVTVSEISFQRSQQKDGKVAINQASATELETLPGIGPAKAAAIISYREENGPFKTVDDLLNISGIGPKSLEKIKEHVMIK